VYYLFEMGVIVDRIVNAAIERVQEVVRSYE
jgi:hypothetical protein